MATALGLTLGAGLFLVWWSTWAPDQDAPDVAIAWADRLRDDLVQAGAHGVGPGGVVGTAVGLGLLVALLGGAVMGSVAIGLCFGVIAARGPFALVRARARARRARMRDVWPEAVDNLASGIRAGLSLPEALSQLGERGPEALREPFTAFAHDYRSTGRFSDSLDALKGRLADPVADRIVEALRLTRDVGGTDIGQLLRTLSHFLREDARTRGELEARQSWTVNAAKLAVAAPWVVLLMLASQPQNARAYDTAMGTVILVVGGAVTVLAYRLMSAFGRLPQEARVMR